MTDLLKTDLCVIGAGSGGLSVAAGASQMGADTVLVEAEKMGGDCLNYGCVPSKALLAAGHAAHRPTQLAAFGLSRPATEINFSAVHQHVHDVIKTIAPNDSRERFTGLGVNVITATGQFIDRQTLQAGTQKIRAKRFVIATGSKPAIPPLPGLDKVPYLTNENIFDLTTCPEHLIIIGGGPIGLEMAQAFHRLGARVTVLALAFMEQDDPEMSNLLLAQLREEGIDLRTITAIEDIHHDADHGYTIEHLIKGQDHRIHGSHLLVATGRTPNLSALNLDAAKVDHDARGITVNKRLRTSNPRIYAIGDVTGGYQFTHMAGYDAGIIIRIILFRIPSSVDHRAVPRVTFTDPEMAHVGLREDQARENHGQDLRILRWPFSENDRAQAERHTGGMIKVVTTRRGKILGATIIGPHAGEVIQSWQLAISQKLNISAMANMIAPYPTYGEISKRVSGSFYTPSLFNEKTRKMVRILFRMLP